MVEQKNRQKNAKSEKYASPFNGMVRIRRSQLDFLKNTKRDYSIAGYLDMIINFWKEYEGLGFYPEKQEKNKKKRKKR